MKCFFVLLALLCAGPSPGFEEAVLVLTGASSVEDLDETTLERFRSLNLHPVDINTASRSRLLATGLFTPFQVASLLDYRKRTGDILSFTELALVDGFREESVRALSLFVSISASGPPGKRPGGFRQDLMLRGSARGSSGEIDSAFGIKYRARYGEMAEFNWSTRTTYTSPSVEIGTLSAAVYGRKTLGKLVLGHFNARFGQGLALWSGFSPSPYGSVNSLARSPTGFSATGSFSPAHCGVAADFDFGHWSVGGAYSFKGSLPMAAASYIGKRFTAGITATGGSVSVDWRVGIPDAALYGELCWKGRLDGVAGIIWIPRYGLKTGALVRYTEGVPELDAAIGGKQVDAVTALSSKQLRILFRYHPTYAAGSFGIAPSLRLQARRTDVWRLEARGELQLSVAPWMLRARGDLVFCKGPAWLVYAEAGKSGGAFRFFLRSAAFSVDDWAARIWVYERDAPGSFNVPAYYGKGWSASLYSAWKINRRHALYLRVSAIGYPCMTEPKKGRTEVRLQYQLRL